MRIIFINRFFYPDHSGTSQILSDVAFALAQDGEDVLVLTSRLTYDGGRKLCRRETIQGVQIVRLPTSAFGRIHLSGRALDYATFYLAAILATGSLPGSGREAGARTGTAPSLRLSSATLAPDSDVAACQPQYRAWL
jgi:hypothetical protein